MRRIFADILNGAGVDVFAEYHSLHMLVFQRYGFYSDMEECFEWMPFSGTAYNLRDFNERNQFDFEHAEYTEDLDDLLLFCEYVYNFAVRLNVPEDCGTRKASGIVRHINALADKIGYRFVHDGELWILVPRNDKIEAAAEVVPEGAGNDLFRYDYRGYKGDLEGKRTILSSLAATLEPTRAKLSGVAKAFTSDYFYLVNNLNIRHNNIDPADPGKYNDWVAQMPPGELEGWYDTVRDMSAAAFLLLEYLDKKDGIDETKQW